MVEKTLEQVIDIIKRPMERHAHPRSGYGTYVLARDVVSRLNEAFNYKWSSELVSVHEERETIIAHVRLTVELDGKFITHDGIAGAPIAFKRNTKEAVDLGNNYKSAFTNALKKAAAALGIGVEEGEEEPAQDEKDVADAAVEKYFGAQKTSSPGSNKSTTFPMGRSLSNQAGSSNTLRPRLSGTISKPVEKPEETKTVNTKFPAPVDGEKKPTDIQIQVLKNLVEKVIKPPMTEEMLIKKAVPGSTKASFSELTYSEAQKAIIVGNDLNK